MRGIAESVVDECPTEVSDCIRDFSRLGTGGKHSSHIERDFHRTALFDFRMRGISLASLLRLFQPPPPSTSFSGLSYVKTASMWFGPKLGFDLEPCELTLPLETMTSYTLVPTIVHAMPMYKMLQALWQAGPLQRSVSLLGREGALGIESFWRNSLGLAWARAHPEVAGRSLDDLACTLGVVIHVDGVEVLGQG